MHSKLLLFANSLNKNISKRIFSDGGIYYPKDNYINNNDFTVSIKLYKSISDDLESLKEEELDFNEYQHILEEGRKVTKFVNTFERNPKIRSKVIEIKKTKCCICGFNFYHKYGERGNGFIEVHHIKPISEYTDVHEVDIINDFEVVCSNCHRMIHRKKDHILTIREMKELLSKQH